MTALGEVTVDRLAYRSPGQGNLHPEDAVLNLPVDKHSHGLWCLAAIEAARGAFDEAPQCADPSRRHRQTLDRRPHGALRDGFHRILCHPPLARSAPSTELLMLQIDGKGIVMRPDAPRCAPMRYGRPPQKQSGRHPRNSRAT